MREFTVLRVTARNQLLLKGDGKPVDKPTPVLFEGNTVAKALDTIGRVSDPFYIATPLTPTPLTLVNRTLKTKT